MIEYVFCPSRIVNGKRVLWRMFCGRYSLDKGAKPIRVSLNTHDREVARKRLRNIVIEKQREAESKTADISDLEDDLKVDVEVTDAHTKSNLPTSDCAHAQSDAQNFVRSGQPTTLADICARFVQDVNLTEAEGLSHVLTSLVTSLHCDKLAARAGIEPATK